MQAVSANAVRFDTLVARESVDARTEVVEWAQELFVEQLHTYGERKRKRLPLKRPPTKGECREKSREIRIKRERDATYWNDTTNTAAQYR